MPFSLVLIVSCTGDIFQFYKSKVLGSTMAHIKTFCKLYRVWRLIARERERVTVKKFDKLLLSEVS